MTEKSKTRNRTAFPPPRTPTHAVARWCILPLLDSWVMPNHITTLRLLTGLAAAGCFAAGSYFWNIWGGIIFVVSAILDRADGELARLGNKSTPGGHWYDLRCDTTVNVLVFVGIGLGLRERLGLWGPAMGVIAGVAVGATFMVVFRLHESGSHPSIAFRYPAGFDFDDTLFVIAIFAWLNALLPLLIAAVVGAPLFLVFALWQARKVLGKPKSSPAPDTTPQPRAPIHE
jgi:archaetidylinositol phosphate synthase